MSQPIAQMQVPNQPQFVVVPVRETNGLGVAGFFIALVGLFIPTGLVALLGLLISLVALGRSPRGFAAMGVFVGLLGTAIWAALLVVAVLGVIGLALGALVVGALAFVMTNPELIEFTRDMGDVGLAVIEYEDSEGALPDNLALLSLSVPSLTDPWGKPYRYQITSDSDFGFDISSGGGDGEFGTDDDLVLSRIDRVWENAFETFGEKMEELGTRIERMNQNGQYGQYGFPGHHDIVSASAFGCTKTESKSKSKTRAEVYEQVAKALVVQEPLADGVTESDQAPAAQPD